MAASGLTSTEVACRRAGLSAGLVAAEVAHVIEVLDGIERLVAAAPEVELLGARRCMHSSEDE